VKSRTLEIIKLLIHTAEVMTITEIADRLSVSTKTIRNDLKEVESLLEDSQVTLVKKTGVGISLVGEEAEKFRVYNRFAALKDMQADYTSRDRRLYILQQLLLGRKAPTVTSLQDELFVSRPSVYKDLDKVREWLTKREIELVFDSDKSLVLHAGEKRIRKAIADLFLQSETYDQIVEMVERAQGESTYAAMNFFSYGQKSDLLSVEEEDVNELVNLMEERLGVTFVTADRMKLMIRVAIAITRLKAGYRVTLWPETMLDLSTLPVFDRMKGLNIFVQRTFGVFLPEEEWAYLLGLAIASKTHTETPGWNASQKLMVINRICANEIVETTKKFYRIEKESIFFDGLSHHLLAVFNKIKYEKSFENDNLEEIKQTYPDAYQIAEKSRQIFEDVFSHPIPDEEVGYIAMHIAAALERSKRPLRTVIVYYRNYAEIKLMKEVLKNQFHQLELDKVVPVDRMDTIDFDQVDLVISSRGVTVPEGVRSLIMPTVFLKGDLNRVTKLIRTYYEEENRKRLVRLQN